MTVTNDAYGEEAARALKKLEPGPDLSHKSSKKSLIRRSYPKNNSPTSITGPIIQMSHLVSSTSSTTHWDHLYKIGQIDTMESQHHHRPEKVASERELLMTCIRGLRTENGLLVTINNEVLQLPPLQNNEVRHSPTGFNWSYGGSGPAELARAILIAVFPGNEEVRHSRCYQRFKWSKIAPAQGDYLELTSTEIEEWYADWTRTHGAE